MMWARSGSVRGAAVLLILGGLPACSAVPAGTYYAAPADPATVRLARTLGRAAVAAGDDPSRYAFAFIRSPTAECYSDEDATFYVTDGLMRLPDPVVDAVIAHEVAHEVLGHAGSRRKLSLMLSAGFSAAGLFAPGTGLLDFVVNPLAVRAFSRRQEIDADRKAVEILRAMGYPAPRRTLVEALRAVDAVVPRPKEGLGGLLDTHPPLGERLDGLEPLETPGPAMGVNAPARISK